MNHDRQFHDQKKRYRRIRESDQARIPEISQVDLAHLFKHQNRDHIV